MRYYRDERDVQFFLNDHLDNDEKLVWCGSPEQGIVFSKTDRFMIPFSIFFFGFSLFWEFLAISMKAPIFMPIFGSLFVLIGLYLFIGRFFYDSLRRKNTYYGLTNKRVIVVRGITSKRIISKSYNQVTGVTIEERLDKSGTIQFDRPSIANIKNSNLSNLNYVSFENIPEAKTVYNLINDFTKTKNTP